MPYFQRRVLTILFLLAWTVTGLNVAFGDQSGWLSVRDCGVSGSEFQTTATTAADSNRIVVKDAGDFKVGQGVMVSKCNIRYSQPILWGTGPRYQNLKPLENSVEVRGYDGNAGSWPVYVLDIEPSASPAFRWTDDLGRTWKPKVPITHDWQPLNSGIEVRLNRRDWESGYVIAFSARDQLVSRIEKIEGNVLTLTDTAKGNVNDAVVRHNDTFALQAAVDRALAEGLNLRIPAGHYCLSRGITVKNARSLVIEGESAVDTLIDISEGEGNCISLIGGIEVTLRNLRMTGFMGFDERDKAGEMNTLGSTAVWGFALKPCAAVNTSGTKRLLVENCHASRMSGECFVSGALDTFAASGVDCLGAGCGSRLTTKAGYSHSISTTYLRCSVTDSARNAFNDLTCGPENTSVLYCRIENVGGCTWEGASRFVKFIGNYVRNAGTVAIGNLGLMNRDESFPELGAGQHIVADNVFESSVPYGGAAIVSARGSTQVIIRNNQFINFNASAVVGLCEAPPLEYPASNMTVVGNIFDMTCVGQPPIDRTAVRITHNDVIIADNQIYVRGQSDPSLTGIMLHESAVNVNVHDNLIRNCGHGIATARAAGTVVDAVDPRTFVAAGERMATAMDPRYPGLLRGWGLVWLVDGKQTGVSVIDSCDWKTQRCMLREPREMKAGDCFEVYPPSANWLVHDNTVTGCLRPIVLDSYGSETSIVRDNLVSRGDAIGVKQAIEVRGQFQLIGNRLSGFNEENSAAIALIADPLGRVGQGMCRDNTVERCSHAFTESEKGLWNRISTKQANP